MHFSTIIAAATLALSAAAAPTEVNAKSFKLGFTFPGKGTLYLTATGKGSASPSGAVECSITGGSITCDGKGLGWAGHEMTKLVPGKSNVHNKLWSIDNNDMVTWGDGPHGKPMKFSLVGSDIWAQDCTNHPDKAMFKLVGTAKAYYA